MIGTFHCGLTHKELQKFAALFNRQLRHSLRGFGSIAKIVQVNCCGRFSTTGKELNLAEGRRHKTPPHLARQLMAVLKGISTAVTQKLLEHSSPDLTNKVYTNVDPVLRHAVDQIPVGDWL